MERGSVRQRKLVNCGKKCFPVRLILWVMKKVMVIALDRKIMKIRGQMMMMKMRQLNIWTSAMKDQMLMKIHQCLRHFQVRKTGGQALPVLQVALMVRCLLL